MIDSRAKEISRQPFPPHHSPVLPEYDEQARETEAQFKELLAHLHQVFWMKNAADTAVLYVSPTYEKIWGRTRRSLYDNSHTFLDAVHPEDRDRVAEAMSAKHVMGGYEEEYRITHPDGSTRWIWARSYPVRDAEGNILRYAGVAEDISERKWAEKERARLAAIIEHVDDSIVHHAGWNHHRVESRRRKKIWIHSRRNHRAFHIRFDSGGPQPKISGSIEKG
jgi:PAS domain S-box-containing protein